MSTMSPMDNDKAPGIHPAYLGLAFVLAGGLSGLVTLLLGRRLRQNRRRMRRYLEDEIVRQESITLADVSPGATAADLTPEMLAAIMVAVGMHQRIRRKQAAPAMRTHQPGTLPNRWIGSGRVGQNQTWHPKRR